MKNLWSFIVENLLETLMNVTSLASRNHRGQFNVLTHTEPSPVVVCLPGNSELILLLLHDLSDGASVALLAVGEWLIVYILDE